MIDYLLADIGTPLEGWLTPFNVYVTLSRAHGQNNIRRIQDFDDSLFTTIPCELLERVDGRLARMRWEMKRKWMQMIGQQ